MFETVRLYLISPGKFVEQEQHWTEYKPQRKKLSSSAREGKQEHNKQEMVKKSRRGVSKVLVSYNARDWEAETRIDQQIPM